MVPLVGFQIFRIRQDSNVSSGRMDPVESRDLGVIVIGVGLVGAPEVKALHFDCFQVKLVDLNFMVITIFGQNVQFVSLAWSKLVSFCSCMQTQILDHGRSKIHASSTFFFHEISEL